MTLDRSLSRRGFLKQSAAAATTGVAAPLFIPRSALAAAGRPGANDRVKLGLIGTQRRGGQLLDCIPGEGQLVAIADCANGSLWHERRRFGFSGGVFKTPFQTGFDYRSLSEKWCLQLFGSGLLGRSVDLVAG